MPKKKPNNALARVQSLSPRRVLDRLSPAQREAMEEIAAWARETSEAVPRTGDIHRILVEETGLPLSLSVFRSWFHNAIKK